jgi:uncharacterized protein YjdB
MRSPRTSLLSMFAVVLILSTACNTQRLASVEEEVPVASVTLSPPQLSLTVGGRVAVLAVVVGTNGNSLSGRSVAWSSSNAAIATVAQTGETSGEVLGVALGTTSITATSGGKSSSISVTITQQPAVPVDTIVIAPSSASVDAGQTVQLTAVAKDASGNILNGRAISWSSSNTSIATVSSSGLVTGVSPGMASIAAASEGQQTTATITVMTPPPAPVASVEVAPTAATVVVAQTVQLTATPKSATGTPLTGRTVTWTSSNNAVATFSSSGLVTGVAAGAATITATSEGRSGTSAVTVTAAPPVPVATVTVTPSTASVVAGQTVQLAATLKDANGNMLTGRAVTWSSSNAAAATVSATGLVTGVSAGTVTITAMSEGKTGTASITVTAPPPPPPPAVASVSVTPATASVVAGQTVQLTATPQDASGNALTGRVVTWASSNTAVATVNASGLVTGVSAGSATITATSEGKSGTATVTVTATVTNPGAVTNLAVASVAANAVTLSFTEVHNGAGAPASYDVRYAVSPLSWGPATSVAQGTCAVPLAGTAIGATRTCTVQGLTASTNYQFQLVAFRGTLTVDAVFGALSNVASATTAASTAPICPYRGSCNLEPGLSGRSDLLLFEDWEASNWQTHWTSIGFATNMSAVSTPLFSGSKSLEVRVPTGQHDGATFEFDFTSAGLSEPEELYFRYYVRFNDTWQRNGDGEIGKLPGLSGTYGMAGWGCRPVDGSNCWSERMINFDAGSTNQIGFYVYHADMTGTCGDHLRWPDLLQRNQWYCIETRVRLNTIAGGRGNNDGVLQGWIDERLVFTRSNLRFRDVSSHKIERMWGNIYVGGNWTADRDMAINFDNAVIARNRIGCAH